MMMKEIKRCRQLYKYTERPVMAVAGMVMLLLLGLLFAFGGGTLHFYEPIYFSIAFNMVKQELLKMGTSGLGATSPFYKTMVLKVSNIWIAAVNFISYIIVAILLLVRSRVRSNQQGYMSRLWQEPEVSEMLLAASVILALTSVLIVVSYKYFGIPILMGIVLLFVLNKNMEMIPDIDMTAAGAFLLGMFIVAAGCAISVIVQKLLYRKPFSKYAFDRPRRAE